MRHASRVVRVAAIVVACLAVVVGGFVTARALHLGARVRGQLQQAGVLPPPLPLYERPIAPADRVTARRLVVAELRQAQDRGDYEQVAMLNAMLGQEAFQRAFRTLQAWEAARDVETGLVPHAVSRFHNEWDSEDVAADLFPHLLIAGMFLDPEDQSLWMQALESERRICGPLSCRVALDSDEILEEDLDTRIFGTSEYAKDGLLAVTERFGDGPWFERMREGVDAILQGAYVETSAGMIPSNGTEANGELLQVLSRLYWATGEARYLDMAERIAEAYLFDVLPKNYGLPADYWGFAKGVPLREDQRFRPGAESNAQVQPFRLVDHGGEIIPGLAELYLVERVENRPQADSYREPLQAFFDRIVTTGRTEEGLWYNSVDVVTGEPFDDRPADTWGYILNGLQAYDLAEGTERYAPEIQRAMLAASNQRSIRWEGNYQDGYADAIESMLYLLPWYDIPECHTWVDDEIEVMFLKQQDSGFVEGWYLDGNFVRTALMYGQYKTQGLMLDSWREDVRLGAALDSENDALYVHVAAQDVWAGKLRFDVPRHRTFWNMPFEYPRLNGLPEWYVVGEESAYQITDLDTGESATYSGKDLAQGLPISLGGASPAVLRLRVSTK